MRGTTMRSTWVDINPDWLDYVEARVEALEADNKRLRAIIKILTDDRTKERDEQQMPSMLVC